MARTKHVASDEGVAAAAPESAASSAAPVTATPAAKPAALPKPATRVRALAHIRRATGNVDANSEFTPANDKELKWLLDNGHAEKL